MSLPEQRELRKILTVLTNLKLDFAYRLLLSQMAATLIHSADPTDSEIVDGVATARKIIQEIENTT